MNQSVQIADKRLLPEHIISLLVPLADRMLLLPTVSVAEMALYERPIPIDGAPQWLLGYYSWRDHSVPLISFECLTGGSVAPANPRSRVAVLNNTGTSSELPFIGVLTQNLPRLAHVVPESIKQDPQTPPRDYELMRVVVEQQPAIIPDLGRMEKVFLQWYNS